MSEPPQAAGEKLTASQIESLFRQYHDLVLQAAYRVTGRAEDAEEVLQTVFLRLLRRQAPPPELGAGARGYFKRAAVNAAVDLLRSRKARPAAALDDPFPTLAATEPDAQRRLVGRQWHQRLRRALAGLSPQAAQIFALRYFEELGNGEIARLLGISAGAVGISLHRSRTQLRRVLDLPAGDTP